MRSALTVFLLVALLTAAALPAQQTFTVNVTYDAPDINPGDGDCNDGTGNCTLRAAVMEANAQSGDDVIMLPAGTYPITVPGANEQSALTGDLDVRDTTGTLTILGAGVSTTIIDASGLGDRIFDVWDGATLVAEDLTITGGLNTGLEEGGGVLVRNGDLALTRCLVSFCASPNGHGFRKPSTVGPAAEKEASTSSVPSAGV